MNLYIIFINQTEAARCCEWADVKKYLVEQGIQFAFVVCGESQWNVRISRTGVLLKSKS